MLDEYPYLLAHSPELPSVLQEIYDEAQRGDRPSAALILCGSALSVMTEILSGAKPLRGLVYRVEDMLVDRRPSSCLADPVVRFAETVTAPNRCPARGA